MGYQWNSWVINLQTHAGNIVDTLQEAGMQRFLCDAKHFRVVGAAIVKHLLDGRHQGEGGDVQHVSSVASLAPTLSPVLIKCTSLRIFPGEFSGDA